VERLSYIDKVFLLDVGYGGKVGLTAMPRNIGTLLALRRERFDLAVNMRTLESERGARKIKFLLDVIRPAKTAGRDTDGRGRFFDVRVPESGTGQKYEMEYDIDTVRALGAEVTDRHVDLMIDRESAGRVNEILEEAGITGNDTLIGIHAGGMPSRRWPAENFFEAMNLIRSKVRCKFVITGGRSEAGLAKRLEGRDAVNLAGKLSLSETGALIKRCRLFISNDTSPMHMAAVLRTPLVAIFGPGDIVRFDPRNISDKVQVLYKKAPCAPCEKVTCKEMACLKAVSPEEVTDAAMRLVG
jgi:ADP-heptose:LPS heptosyltransferase